NSITSMGMFIKMAQDAELKAMLERHLPAHIQDYNIKVEYLSKADGPTQRLEVSKLVAILGNYTTPPTSNFPPLTPRTDAQTLNDREIATSYLLTLKRAGREYAWAAMEMSNPGLREFLKDAFTMSCNHAFEIWQWMVNKGFYPIEPATESSSNTVGSIYKKVNEPVTV
ncbi:MAG: putative spore coat protein, partial [Clostridia bacterium]|nr:putative spore coat protein [Clostridia bacterium]